MRAPCLAIINAADEYKLMPKTVLNDSSARTLCLPIIELWPFCHQSLSTFPDKDCDFFDHITATENLPIIPRLVFSLLFAQRSSLPPKADALDPFRYRMEPQKESSFLLSKSMALRQSYQDLSRLVHGPVPRTV